MRFLSLAFLACVSLAPRATLAQTATKSLGALGDPFVGNVGYYATGNTMAEPDPGAQDGLACVLQSNTATVPASQVGVRAQIEKAYLYYSGSVYKYSATGTGGDLATIDRDVALQLPGEAAARNFTAEIVYTAEVADGNHFGKSYFYTARVDFTEALKATRTLAGTYTFSKLLTQVCNEQPEVTCAPTAMPPPKCSVTNYLATASFFIVLVYKDPALPPRAVKLFDGLEVLTNSKPPRTVTLDNIQVSAIPRGQLTFYGIEGDANTTGDSATISANKRPAVPLGNVLTPAPPNPTSFDCGDASWPNWSNNLFDSSTVLDPENPTRGACTRGIDIDTYDISSVLQANDRVVDVNLQSTGLDSFGIAFAAVQVDVFRPVIDVDSRKQVLFRTSNDVAPNGSVVYRVGISNTGNIPATGIRVSDDMPLGVSNLRVLRTPPGSTDNSTVSGGLSGTGKIDVSNISVFPGDIFEVRYSVDVTCPVPDGLALINSAAISDSAEGAKGTVLFSPTLRVSDPNNDICEGRTGTQTGTIPDIFQNRKLLGGAGCNASSGLSLAGLCAAMLLLRRRWLKLAALVCALLVAPDCRCRSFVPPPEIDTNPPEMMNPDPLPTAPEQEPMHPGNPCPSAPEMVALDSGVCIDRYESVVEGGTARVSFGAVPTAGLSFGAAKAACEAAGKRLCTGPEWERACRGTAQALYPYGDAFVAKRCNGFDAEWGEALEAGATTDCASDFGVFDLSGNLNEWVSSDYPFVASNGAITMGKQLRGGSFIGNASGLTCTALAGADPSAADARAGVRCCK